MPLVLSKGIEIVVLKVNDDVVFLGNTAQQVWMSLET
jgi:hypothetical protein